MTVNISPQSEARLTAAARQSGVEPGALVEELITRSFPPAEAAPPVSARNAAAIALLDSWLDDAPTDPEEVRRADAEAQELVESLNRNRVESGERPLFPAGS